MSRYYTLVVLLALLLTSCTQIERAFICMVDKTSSGCGNKVE